MNKWSKGKVAPWHTCAGYELGKKWAIGVGIIGEMRELINEIADIHISYLFKVKSVGFEEMEFEFRKSTIQEAVAAKESLVNWIKDVQG